MCTDAAALIHNGCLRVSHIQQFQHHTWQSHDAIWDLDTQGCRQKVRVTRESAFKEDEHGWLQMLKNNIW